MDFQVRKLAAGFALCILLIIQRSICLFQEIIMFLQCLPTQKWTDHEVELLLSEAFVLKSVWQGAENHFTGSGAMNAPLGGGMGGR